MNGLHSLSMLLGEIGACRVCRDAPRGSPGLPHEPKPVIQAAHGARLCIAGQAPGVRVHKSGIPFTDPSGERLRAWLQMDKSVFYDPGRVAIIPMGFCFPGLDAKAGDLPPRRECAPEWRARVISHLPNIELILAIGLYAQEWHLGTDRSPTLTETVRDWRRIVERPVQPRVLPLPHPSWRNNAWLSKNLWFDAEVLPFLRGEVARLLTSPCGNGS